MASWRCSSWWRGIKQQLERRTAPERRDAHDVVVGEHDTFPIGELGLDRRADHTATGEAGERPLLVEDLAGHERQAEHLGVRVGDRRAGLATVVDDDLGVAHLWGGGVLGEPALQHEHQLFGLVVGEVLETAVVVAGEDQHLVDAARLGRHVDRTEVMHDEAGVSMEGRIPVGQDAHLPVPTLVERLQRRQRAVFVPGAERARPRGVGLGLAHARREVARPLGSLGHDRDPAPSEWVETHLAHSYSPH